MIKKEELKNIVYFDVETAGAYPTHDDLVQTNPRLAKLWEKRAKYFRGTNPELSELTDSEIYSQKAGLEAEFGRVVCVSFGIWDNGEHRMTSFYGEDEKEILEKTSKVLANASAKGMKIFSSRKHGLLQFVFAVFLLFSEFVEVENHSIDLIDGHCLSDSKDFFLFH